ncbi:hypothetical protein Ahy_B02g058962 isoform B [Arachis hypogaea]|uniref:Uncharacterized protein n=1 Tax=Arachis hypogaea TaxID=3818 RepID=A0A445AFQ9_ARAHY|nr:hypothetical protein Ahy_B02g058962 isoform B [Arachis hypogaea]
MTQCLYILEKNLLEFVSKLIYFKKLVPRISVLGSELHIEYEENNDLSLKGTASGEACNTLTFNSLCSSHKSMILRWYDSR